MPKSFAEKEKTENHKRKESKIISSKVFCPNGNEEYQKSFVFNASEIEILLNKNRIKANK